MQVTGKGMFISGQRECPRDVLEERALRAASGLRSLGVAAGNAVALLLRNDFAFFEATFAAQAIGAYAVPVNWHLAAPEVAYVLEDSGARVLVAHADLLDAIPEVVAAAERAGVNVLCVPTPREVIEAYGLDPAKGNAGVGAVIWDQWLSGFEPLAELSEQVTENIYYTSGTTGLPKGVRRFPVSREAAAEFSRMRDALYGIEPHIRGILPGPLYHSAPNSFSMRAARVGDGLVLMPRFSAERFLALVEKHRITNAFMVPTMLVRLMKLPEQVRARYDVSSLSYVMIAAAPCPAEVKRAMIDWWGPIIHEFYGSTELGYMTLCNSQEALDRPGTVGRVVDGTVLKALDENGDEVPPGTPGELYGRMPQYPDFTYNNRPEERAACERDGLVTGGDVGYFDAEGYVYLCDRTREMVISGGVNIYPAEIEAVLIGMPGVRDCAVFGIPDAEFGEKLLAVVQPMDGQTNPGADAVMEYLRERVAGYKVPREVEFRDDLPRDDAGKIYKRRLRDPYWEGETRRI